MSDAASVLVQYGALGVALMACGVAVRVLFARVTAAADAERARADRNEDELRKQNALMVDKIIPILAQITQMLAADARDREDRARAR